LFYVLDEQVYALRKPIKTSLSQDMTVWKCNVVPVCIHLS